MRSLPVLILIAVFMMPALGGVYTSNSYYSEGMTVNEDVGLNQVDYTNFINIYPNYITLSSVAANSTGSHSSSATDSIKVNCAGGPIGATLAISGQPMSYGRALTSNDNLTFSYSLPSGGADSVYFYNKFASDEEHLESAKNSYNAKFQVSPDNLNIDGYGSRFSFTDEDSYFIYNNRITQMGLWADTNAYLFAKKSGQVKATPVIYDWDSSAQSDGKVHAVSNFNMAFVAGDRHVDAMINGIDSLGFMATVPSSGKPWDVIPIPNPKGKTGVQTIEDMIKLIKEGVVNSGYMNWELNP